MRRVPALSISRRALFLLPAALGLLCSGCLVPASRLAAYRDQYQQLCEKNKALESQLLNLDAHSRKLESHLVMTEGELSTVDRRSRADRNRLDNFQRERDEIYRRFGEGPLPSGVGQQLAALAQRYPGLYYDEASGAAKLDADILFATAQAGIQPAARQMLDEFIAILKSDGAGPLRVMIVGHTDDRRIEGDEARDIYPNNWHLGAARALAVSDYLRVRGLQEDRLGVATYGKFQPIVANTSEPNRQRNRRVEIFLIAPEVPVVGWTETFTRVYR
ncbi:MAG: OmpA family protein [Planctomycetales bacterium]|nr:OmpA family protein [Planctomycetales bacterium]NIM09452.1 OmpA family protein [Planctomycetales bacterium]NIN08934.1 OmpA family protein [Planctomycetales bacterium]NIN78055.1 OmpA family protein [Planctomycetales bacterium]NIO35233.1 OmpA family protein [Planctomycetales bacterium]